MLSKQSTSANTSQNIQKNIFKNIENNQNNEILKLSKYISEKYGFEITNILGKGGYSNVFEIKTNKTSNIYAYKIEIVKNKNLTQQDIKKTEEKNILKEIEKSLSKTLKHENIIKTLSTFTDEYKIDNETYTIHSIFMEKSRIGNLNKFIQIFNNGDICRNTINPNNYKINWIFNLSEFTIKKFVNEIVNGLQYIKLAKLVHLDIKPENILLCKEYILKICNFSLLKIIDTESKKTNLNFSTFVYQDPNVYNNEKSIDTADLYKVDLFSLGCIIYFMIFNKLLIDKNLKNYNNIENTKNKVIKCVEKGIKEINDNQKISKTLKYLTNSLLNPEIKKRISLNELSQNEFLNAGQEIANNNGVFNYNNPKFQTADEIDLNPYKPKVVKVISNMNNIMNNTRTTISNPPSSIRKENNNFNSFYSYNNNRNLSPFKRKSPSPIKVSKFRQYNDDLENLSKNKNINSYLEKFQRNKALRNNLSQNLINNGNNAVLFNHKRNSFSNFKKNIVNNPLNNIQIKINDDSQENSILDNNTSRLENEVEKKVKTILKRNILGRYRRSPYIQNFQNLN